MHALSLLLLTKVAVWHAYSGGEERALQQVVREYNTAQAAEHGERAVQVEAIAVPYGSLADKLRPQLVLDVTDRLRRVQQQLGAPLQVSQAAWQQAVGTGSGLAGVSSIALRPQLGELRPLAVESRPGLLVAYVELVGTVTLDIH